MAHWVQLNECQLNFPLLHSFLHTTSNITQHKDRDNRQIIMNSGLKFSNFYILTKVYDLINTIQQSPSGGWERSVQVTSCWDTGHPKTLDLEQEWLFYYLSWEVTGLHRSVLLFEVSGSCRQMVATQLPCSSDLCWPRLSLGPQQELSTWTDLFKPSRSQSKKM